MRTDRARGARTRVLLAAGALTGAVLVPGLTAPTGAATAPARAQATAGGEVVQRLSHDGRAITVRLRPFALRAPSFEVLVQGEDGRYTRAVVQGDRAFLGTVDGDPAAVVTAIRDSQGQLDGQVVFDRGGSWFFDAGTVTGTRGLTPPTAFRWPTSTDASRLVSTSPGQAGRTTHRFDLAFDVDNDFLRSAGSVPRALDDVERTAVSLVAPYVGNALLRPAVGRVVIRGSQARSPYSGGEDLRQATAHWRSAQGRRTWDAVAVLNEHTGGGVAYLETAGTDSGVSINGGAGPSRAVVRHELGHNWGAGDNHTNGPEGATIESGNQYDRFDGTELSAIFRYRDRRQAETAPFTPVGRFVPSMPPYAALDLLDGLTSGVGLQLRPTRNDHDANGDALALVAVSAQSARGGRLVRSGDVVTYVPPRGGAARTVDWFRYVVRDATGRRATGVAIARVSPATPLAPSSTWNAQPVVTNAPYVLVNRQSGLPAALPAGRTGDTPLVARGSAGDAGRFRPTTAGQLRNVANGRCMDAFGGTVVVRGCTSAASQRWTVTRHPEGGLVVRHRATGGCMTPAGGSIRPGATMVLTACSRASSQRWVLSAPAVGTWKARALPASLVLRQGARYAGTATSDTSSTPALVMRAPGGARTAFTSTASGGLVVLRHRASDRCVDVYRSSRDSGAEVGTFTCQGSDNQAWRVLANPAGGVSFRSASSGLCLASAPAHLVQVPCGVGYPNRWSLS